jgi:hypothetical protein
MSKTAPVLLIAFNRISTTKLVFEQIAKSKPSKFFVFFDGPRIGNPTDELKCAEVRKFIRENISWDCEYMFYESNENLGCGYGPVRAINWFFEHVSYGIILEDDCLPNSSFFNFCSEVLLKYLDNEKIMGVGGSNFLNHTKLGGNSYFFSKYTLSWGWATWKRAWNKFDHYLTDLDQFKQTNKIAQIDKRFIFKRHWYKIFDGIKINKEYDHIWDYQWLYSVWNNNGLIVLPAVNLVSNIGFGIDATHTFEKNHLSNTETVSLDEIIHPTTITRNDQADAEISATVFNIPKRYCIPVILLNKINSLLQKLA